MKRSRIVYQLRIVRRVKYFKEGGFSRFLFGNGVTADVHPGCVDHEKLEGARVVCRLRIVDEGDGYYLEGLARAAQSDLGLFEFSQIVDNTRRGRWRCPNRKQIDRLVHFFHNEQSEMVPS